MDRRHVAGIAFVVFHGFLSCSGPGREPIATDRPGFLTSPSVVTTGHFQFESGIPSVTLHRAGGAETEAFSFPLLARVGIGDGIELRLASSTWNILHESGDGAESTTRGGGDIGLGWKRRVADEAGRWPATALFGEFGVPVGDDQFSSRQGTAQLGAAFAWTLGEDLALGGTCSLSRSAVDDALRGLVGLALSRGLGAHGSAYVEAVVLPGIAHAVGQSFAGCGATYRVRDDLQFDLSADFGLDSDAPEASLGIGVSWAP